MRPRALPCTSARCSSLHRAGSPAVAPAHAPGAAAPDFTLTDTAGKTVKLSDYHGKYVVLEWTNPECPFVRKHYTSGNMQALQKEWGARDVVWLSINSTNASQLRVQDAARRWATWMRAQGAAPTATLIDGTSATGRAYAAKTTPHMFVIDPDGNVRLQRRDRRPALDQSGRREGRATTTCARR